MVRIQILPAPTFLHLVFNFEFLHQHQFFYVERRVYDSLCK